MTKFERFLEITQLLNKKFGSAPVLYGSLGLSELLQVPLKINDIDILVPEKLLKSDWEKLIEAMKDYGFIMSNEKEHEFKNGNEVVAFAGTDTLQDINLTVGDLTERRIGDVQFYELTPEQYLAVYTYCLKDGYRLTKHSDKEKIMLIQEYLKTGKR